LLNFFRYSHTANVVRNKIFEHPWMFSRYISLRKKLKPLLVSEKMDVVIEGFPRSGNTFAVAAFLFAQNKELRVARHTHAPAQIKLAIEYGVPIILLKRDPVSSITSLAIRDPLLHLDVAIQKYKWYYERVYYFKFNVVVVDFKELTSNYADAIRRLNVAYGTNFLQYHNNPINDAQVFKRVELMELEDSGGKLRETHVSRPSVSRILTAKQIKERLYNEFNRELNECIAIYESL